MIRLKVLLVTALAAASALAHAQSIYVDMDIYTGDAGIGNGAPSSAFGGAAVVAGAWNRVMISDYGPWALFDTNGNPTAASVSWTGSAGGIGFRNTMNSGDMALLLNDGERVGPNVLRFTISGLLNGDYRVFCYAVQPQGNAIDTAITVPGSISPNPQIVTGPMPGNQLIAGITHSVHDVHVGGGQLIIEARPPSNVADCYVNGFQIQAVPEPAALAAFGGCLLLLRRRRCR